MYADDTSLPRCWLDALPLELIDREVARRHPSIPFYLAFAYPRFARYCRERYRLPRDPLSWFARVPLDANPLYLAPWCVVNYAIYLPDDHPRLKRIAEIDDLAELHTHDDEVSALNVASVPCYDGATSVLHSWWDDDLDEQQQQRHHCRTTGAPPPPTDIVAVEQNQYDALTMRLYCDVAPSCEATVVWYRYGVCHRDGDRPALVKRSGSRSWYKNGVLHRDDDLPAVVFVSSLHGVGIQMRWYLNGVWHRDGDRPALIGAHQYGKTTLVQWAVDGKLHRDDNKPAEVCTFDRDTFIVNFYRNGARHRDGDHPAIITNMYVGWYRDGVQLTQNDDVNKSACQKHKDEAKHWLERCLSGDDAPLPSQIASCPYFGVAERRVSR